MISASVSCPPLQGWSRFSKAQPTSVDQDLTKIRGSYAAQPSHDTSQMIAKLIDNTILDSQWTCRILRSNLPQHLTREDGREAICSFFWVVGKDKCSPDREFYSHDFERLTTDVHVFSNSLNEGGSAIHSHFGTWEKVDVILPEPWANSYLIGSDWMLPASLETRKTQNIRITAKSGDSLLFSQMRTELCISDMIPINTGDNKELMRKFQFSLFGQDPRCKGHARFMVDRY